jgi:hypothetical protein
MDFIARLHTALAVQDRDKRNRAIAAVADELNAAEIQEALQRVVGMRISDRQSVLAQLFARWGSIDPHAALAFVKILSKSSDRREAVEAIINGWTETDPDAVEQWIAALPDGSEKSLAWQALIIAEGAVDPQRAISHLANVNLGWRNGEPVIHAIFDRWAKDNPAEAARFADQIASPGLKTEALRIIARQWAEADVAAAVQWADSLRDVMTPGRPTDHGLSVTAGADRTNALNALLETWIARDATAAVDWLAELPQGIERVALICRACGVNEEAVQDPEIAMRLAALLPEGMHREGAIISFLERWAVNAPMDELAWAQQQTNRNIQRSALRDLVPVLQGAGLRAALDFASTLPESAKWIFQLSASSQMAEPATVASWLMQQPNNQEYIPQMAAAWAAKDPAGTSEWLQTLPAQAKDAALVGIVERTVKNSEFPSVHSPIPFENAAEFASQIDNPKAREAALEPLAKAWLKARPDAAREWLQAAPIAQSLKEQWLKPEGSK